MIIHRIARQAPPRPESIPHGDQENQLSGDLPVYYPRSQTYGGFAVSVVEEEPVASPPRPVSARRPHGAHDTIVVELIEEPDGSPWRKLSGLPGSEDEFFRDPETKPDRRPKLPKLAARGENNGAAKLTEAAVIQMRAEARRGVSQRRLARTYKVSRAAVFDVVSGKTWVHVPDEPDEGAEL